MEVCVQCDSSFNGTQDHLDFHEYFHRYHTLILVDLKSEMWKGLWVLKLVVHEEVREKRPEKMYLAKYFHSLWMYLHFHWLLFPVWGFGTFVFSLESAHLSLVVVFTWKGGDNGGGGWKWRMSGWPSLADKFIPRYPFSQLSSSLAFSQFFQHLVNCQKLLTAHQCTIVIVRRRGANRN